MIKYNRELFSQQPFLQSKLIKISLQILVCLKGILFWILMKEKKSHKGMLLLVLKGEDGLEQGSLTSQTDPLVCKKLTQLLVLSLKFLCTTVFIASKLYCNFFVKVQLLLWQRVFQFSRWLNKKVLLKSDLVTSLIIATQLKC